MSYCRNTQNKFRFIKTLMNFQKNAVNSPSKYCMYKSSNHIFKSGKRKG